MIDITKETGIAAAIGLVLGGLAVYGLKRGCSKGMLAGLEGSDRTKTKWYQKRKSVNEACHMECNLQHPYDFDKYADCFDECTRRSGYTR